MQLQAVLNMNTKAPDLKSYNLKQFIFQQNTTFISESFEQHFCLIIIFAVSGCQLRGWPGRTWQKEMHIVLRKQNFVLKHIKTDLNIVSTLSCDHFCDGEAILTWLSWLSWPSWLVLVIVAVVVTVMILVIGMLVVKVTMLMIASIHFYISS